MKYFEQQVSAGEQGNRHDRHMQSCMTMDKSMGQTWALDDGQGSEQMMEEHWATP